VVCTTIGAFEDGPGSLLVVDSSKRQDGGGQRRRDDVEQRRQRRRRRRRQSDEMEMSTSSVVPSDREATALTRTSENIELDAKTAGDELYVTPLCTSHSATE